jgi:hypothetical protein
MTIPRQPEIAEQGNECPESEIRNTKLTVHQERTGPRTSFSSGAPKERSLLFGVEVGGGESKNLLLFFDELQTHHTEICYQWVICLDAQGIDICAVD